MKPISLSVLTKPHAKATVLPNQEIRLFFFEVPKEYLVFIYSISNSWYPNTLLDFRVDGVRIELIERELQNYEFKPPIVAERSIEVIAINKDSKERVLEFWIDGIALKKSDLFY